MKKPYLFLTTILTLIIFYSCKSDSIDACTTDCSKCVILSSKGYNSDNSLSRESIYEHDDNFNITKITEISYSKGNIYSTVITENENVYVNQLLSKATQRVGGQINEHSEISYYPNNKVKKTETKDKNNILKTTSEYDQNGKLVYYYGKYAEIYEEKYTYDSKGNELTKYHYTNGNNDFSYISEYDGENKIIKQIYAQSYPNQNPSTTTSTYFYNTTGKLSEIKYEYVGRVDIDKKSYLYNNKNLLVSTISYLGKVTKSQENRDYDDNGLLIKVSAFYDNSPFEVFQELSYHSNRRVKQFIQKMPQPAYVGYVAYNYDDMGNDIGFELLDNSRKILSKTVGTYLCRK